MFSPSTRKSLATALAGAALASAVAVSGASADLHAIDAAARAAGDLPETTAPSGSYPVGEGYQDLRAPDTRDAAEGYAPTVDLEAVADEPSPTGGFDWVSAAIGAVAGTALLIVLLAFGGGLARRRPFTRGPLGA